MAINKAYSKYRENSVTTASPEELTLMLYNALIRFVMQGQRAIDEQDVQKAHEFIVKAQDIIVEFQATLDPQYEISHNLQLIYDFMYRRLVDANVKKDREVLGEVLKLAVSLRDTWEEAMKLARQQAVVSTVK